MHGLTNPILRFQADHGHFSVTTMGRYDDDIMQINQSAYQSPDVSELSGGYPFCDAGDYDELYLFVYLQGEGDIIH
jgi:hypothetical protein